MRINIIAPYSMKSEGARAIANGLDVKLMRKNGSRYRGGVGKVVLNWGRSDVIPVNEDTIIINNPGDVYSATNKIHAFQLFTMYARDAEIPSFCVPWSTIKAEAQAALDNGFIVIARTKVSSSEGRGIVVVKPGEVLPNAALYTVYQKPTNEYRVHVMRQGGELKTIGWIRKARKIGADGAVPAHQHIRNHNNGYIFAQNGTPPSKKVFEASINAIKALGLDFGAVDVIRLSNGEAMVLEVNTAPGVEGRTVETYINGFKKYFTG